MFGRLYDKGDIESIWNNGAGHKVADEIKAATADLPEIRKQADSAVKFAESAIAASKVNSDAQVAMDSAIAEAKATANSALSDVQQAMANASSDAAQIRQSVVDVQNEVNTAKSANESSVNQLKSEIADAQKHLATVNDQLNQAQSAVANTQAQINSNVAQIESEIAANRTNVQQALNANSTVATQLDVYTKQAQEQGKTIKTILNTQDGFSTAIADVKGNVTKVTDAVTGLTASLKDTQNNVATMQVQADKLSGILSDNKKNVDKLLLTATKLSNSISDAQGRLSTIEQTSSEQATTLSDLQGNLSQVKQTADSVTKTLKDAQGNIEQLQTTAKGTTEQISNLKGDVVSLQKDVKGIKLTIADHDKNIHTLQADSKSLQDDMRDAKGNISSLQKTATSLDSEFKDHDGRLSKVEQTATEHTSELADNKNNIDKVSQKADSLQLLLGNAQNDINNIRVTANGLNARLTTQGNDIQQIKANASGFSTRLAGVEKSGSELASRLNGLKVGTSNLLHDSDTFSSWYKGPSISISTDKYLNGAIAVLKNTGSGGDSLNAQLDGPYDNQPVTWTVYARADNAGDKLHTELWGGGGITDQALTTDWQVYKFTGKRDTRNHSFYLWGCQGNKGNVYAVLPFAVVGNIIGNWAPNASDIADKITTNSLDINATKKMLEVKADQTTVNNLTGQLQQEQAQRKILADQINQKVSSTEYQTLKDKVNGLKVGGRNLLIGTSENEVSGKAYAFADYQISGGLQPNKTYTLSGWARVDQDSLNHHQNVFIDAYSEDWSWSVSLNVNSSLTDQYNKITFTTPSGKIFHPSVTVYLAHPDGGNNENNNDVISGMAFIKKLKLEEGNIDTDYTHAPEDTIASIKKNSTAIDENSKLISLKANQTDVNNIKGTAEQLNARLNIMAGEVKSKVDETRVNGLIDARGYATSSTVQNLISQKAGQLSESITNLETKFNSSSSINLAERTNQGTANWMCDPGTGATNLTEININGVRGVRFNNTRKTTTWWVAKYALNLNNFEPNTDYVISFDVRTSQTINASGTLNIAGGDSLHGYFTNGGFNQHFNANQITHVSVVRHTNGNLDKLNSESFYFNIWNLGQCDWVDFVNFKIARGTIDKGYSPAPSDNATVTQVQSVQASIDGLQSNVTNYKNDTNSKYTQLSGLMQSKVNQGDLSSVRTQLANAINDRVGKGELLSQINLTAGNTLIQSNKLYLDASSVVFSGRAFIPSAAISELDADKLTFYGNGSRATIGASVAQYDQDKLKSTINLQYQGGFEIHSSNNLGSILTMHDDTVRLASKSQVYGPGSGHPLNQQYSGFWASKNYALMNAVDSEGKTTGWTIGPSNSQGYRAYLYDSSSTTQPTHGVGIGTSSRFDVYAGNSNIFLGPDKAELRGSDYATVHGNDHTFIEGGNQQIYMHNGEVNIGNPNDTGNATGVHLRVFGWASYNGYVEAMGWTTKSTLSSKTRIEPLDTKNALDKIIQTDLTTYQYKAEVAQGMTKRHAGPIIDDIHDVAKYYTPDEFINEQRSGRSDADVIGYLMGAVQELKKQLDKVKEKI
ncbi:hypothetical protein LTY58_02760 [Limosilactobacillus rudii]|nr:tail fiber domain-containing protein [Limosilactobacillus rudii]MCD7134019.1 hypothetical protein [Limosilactobacillus rudii]